MNIVYKQHDEIDKSKWNQCIDNSCNKKVYAYSWYLDVVCKDWDVLVLGDYEAVMPLPKYRKYMVNYLLQPYFVQQLGVFAKEVNQELVDSFLETIPEKYRYVELNLNASNEVALKNFEKSERVNCELSLTPSYEELAQNFSKNTRRNIKKARSNNLLLGKELSVNEFVNLKKENPVSKLNECDFELLGELLSTLESKGLGQIYSVCSESGGLCAAAFFVTCHNRIYFLMGASNVQGKDNGAMFLIFDVLIQEYTGKGLVLDFEGSMIPGVARFFKGFGAIENNYIKIKRNTLPFFMKWFKK